MRNLKKFLALVLAMVMAFSLMLTVNAANPVKDFSDASGITKEFQEAADVLTGMKVYQGDDKGNFNPAQNITRAEVAALIYRLATGDVDDVRAGLYANYGNFTDVNESDWFAGYVGYCANAGYIKGKTPTAFYPYDNVTGYEALAMILRAVGYDKNHEFEGATWQTNVSALATQLGIVKDVKTTDYGNTLHLASRRDVVASLLFNAIQVPMVEYSPMAGYNKYQNLVTNTPNPTLGRKYFGLTSLTGIVVGNQETGEDYTLVSFDANWNPSYAYATTPDSSSNRTFEFNTDTGLDMFGHKMKVWYDVNSGTGVMPVSFMSTKFQTVYATFDKATKAEYVYATNDDISTGSLRGAARAAGFANTSTTRWSISYGRFDNAAAAASGNASPVNTYYLVSNNSDKTVDVAVRVYNELARIDKKDTTSTTKTLTLGNTSGVTSMLGANTDGVLRESYLTASSVKDLGSIVLATLILDTTDTSAARLADWQNGMYKLETPKTIEGQIVASAYSTTNDNGDATDITLADGSTLKRSGIMDGQTTTGTASAATINMISSCVTELTNTNMNFGQEYTIYLDKTGRFIGVTTGTDFTFLYGTFADYEIGALGTGSINYAITGVDWDGNIVKNHVLTSITASDGTVYRGSGLATGYNQDNPGGNNILPITKKFLGVDASAQMGNQIKSGPNYGFAIDAAGNLVNGANPYNVVHNGRNYGTIELINDWTIRAGDAANGFADIMGNGTLLATNETKFIVVSGHGTSDLDVKVYTGLTEFLNGSTQVVMRNTQAAARGGYTYYLTRADRYNNVQTANNTIVDSVIMTAGIVEGRSTENLYFYNDTKPTGTKLNGQYDQYVLYNNGEKNYYFIASVDGNATSGTTNAPAADTFYTLSQTGTVNGQPVYAAATVTKNAAGLDYDRDNNGICWTNNGTALGYTYVSTSNLSTARIGSFTYRVDNAKVVDLSGQSVPHATFKSVLDLNNAISSGWTISDVAIVNDGINVSTIYVRSISAAP